VAADADEIRRRYRTVAGVIAARRDGGDPTTGPGTVTE
jgi:hypothetical protein